MEEELIKAKLKLYELILDKYRKQIEEGERKSISELREKVSPNREEVKIIGNKILSNIKNYSYENHFLIALSNVISYLNSIKIVKLPFNVWLDFKTIDEIKIADSIDKSLLALALIRFLGSQNAKVIVLSDKRTVVNFEYNNYFYILIPENGSLLVNEEAITFLSKERSLYAFSDLFFESYDE